jgi:hypothetical protein
MPPQLELELRDALGQLERDSTSSRLFDLQSRFDQWLKTAGDIGEGQSPDEVDDSLEEERVLHGDSSHG